MQAAAPEKSATTNGATWRKVVLVLLVAAATAIVLGAWLSSGLKSPFLAWDFSVFYIAAHMPMRLLYSPDAFAAFWRHDLQPLGVRHWAPYVRPSIFALMSRPLGMLSFWNAFAVWGCLSLCAYSASVAILIRRFRLPAFVVPAYAGFFPAIVGLISGQDACIFLLLVLVGWLLLEGRQDWLAGLIFALCLYKYNLILLVPVLLVMKRRFRALAWFGLGGVLLAVSSVWLASPREYVDLLINIRRIVPDFTPVGLRGFGTAIGLPWCYPVLALIVLIGCCWLMKRLPLTEAFCVAIVGMLLISPYVTWYDSTLLALPIAVLFVRSGTIMRVTFLAILVIQPLWVDSGGPITFTHAVVELFILGYFVHGAGIRSGMWRGVGSGAGRRLNGNC